VWGYCERSGIRGRTVTLKVKFANFQIITRSRTGQMQIRTQGELEELGDGLLEPVFPVARGIRLLGISMSSLAVITASPISGRISAHIPAIIHGAGPASSSNNAKWAARA
jgi:DNA polymerase-4